ncbi:winged helix-turn-helix domain-containing protein [Paraburkholderia kirstenboschensis]|uniref:winged helix-turn-helix domain-containing protein n=1 Tax=Paraburkholderia kirstenboschensis TaxID=1245436 RepID=UPI003743DA72
MIHFCPSHRQAHPVKTEQETGHAIRRAEELLQAVWRDAIVTDDSLAQCVGELRSALGGHRQRVIRTVPHRGYMLELQPIAPVISCEAIQRTRSRSPR